MLKKILLSLVFFVMAGIVASSASGADTTTVTISYTAPAYVINPCPILVDTNVTIIGFHNTTAFPIVVKVWNRNGSIAIYSIPPGGWAYHVVQKAIGDREVKFFDEAGHELAECAIRDNTSVPTLTQWGVIVLVILLIGSTLFVMLKKRKATVPA